MSLANPQARAVAATFAALLEAGYTREDVMRIVRAFARRDISTVTMVRGTTETP